MSIIDLMHEYPLVCIDESSKQHVMETRQPIEAEPGQIHALRL